MMKWLKPQDLVSEADIDRGLRMLLYDGLAVQVMGILTGGAFLVAFELMLGASNKVIGLLAAVVGAWWRRSKTDGEGVSNTDPSPRHRAPAAAMSQTGRWPTRGPTVSQLSGKRPTDPATTTSAGWTRPGLSTTARWLAIDRRTRQPSHHHDFGRLLKATPDCEPTDSGTDRQPIRQPWAI